MRNGVHRIRHWCTGFVSFLFVLAVVLTGVYALSINAEAVSESDLSFALDADGKSYIVADCVETAEGNLVIPSIYNGKPVTAIGEEAFFRCESLTKITIPETVTMIGDGAFCCCYALSDIVIPNSVTTIGNGAFTDCSNITEVIIPNSVVSIGSGAFEYCTQLRYIEIPDSVVQLGSWAFSNCDSLESVVIGNGVEAIGDGTFFECCSLKKLVVGSAVSTVGQKAFSAYSYDEDYPLDCGDVFICNPHGWISADFADDTMYYGSPRIHFLNEDGKEMTEYELESSLTVVPYHCFDGCVNLKSIVIPDGVTEIGAWAFDGCSSLESVRIPASVIDIITPAFSDCSELKAIWVDEGNQHYCNDEMGVLYNKDGTSLIKVPEGMTGALYISAGVTTIDHDAWDGNSLSAIWVDNENPIFSSDVNGVLFNKKKTILQKAPGGMTGAYVVPTSVTCIEWGAFIGASISEIVIPSSVDTVVTSAFADCTELRAVTLSDATEIEPYAFEGCDVDRVIFAEGTKIIGPDTIICKESVKEVLLPDSVDSIECDAFYGCKSLISVWFEGSAPEIDNDAFYGVNTTAYYCTDSSWRDEIKQNYGGTIRWLEMESNRVVASGICGVSGANVKWELSAEGSLRIFGNGAMEEFADYTDVPWYIHRTIVKKAIVEHGVTTIGNYAFFECRNMAETVIPSSVGMLGYFSYYRCSSLKTVKIPDSVTDIGVASFAYCLSLASVELPKQLEAIKDNTFQHCRQLTNVKIPELVTLIGFRAFSNCSSMTGIVIPAAVSAIDTLAFEACFGLAEVCFKGDAPRTGENAFYGVDLKAYYYPDSSWNDSTKRDYGGAITWETMEPDHVVGDASGDGMVNSLDGLLIMRYLNGWELADISVKTMDINKDGVINSLDGLLIMRYLNGWDIKLG